MVGSVVDLWKISDIREILSGQQANRLSNAKQPSYAEVKILTPGLIHAGYFDEDSVTDGYAKSREDIEQMYHLRKFAEDGDIIMKLTSPYEACLITKPKEHYVVPSYCGIIREFHSKDVPWVPPAYICAALNSKVVKSQIARFMSGSKNNPMLKITDLRKIHIPIYNDRVMKDIGELFENITENRRNLSELIETEDDLLNSLFTKGK